MVFWYIVLYTRELLVIFIVSGVVLLLQMHFDFVSVILLSHFQLTLHFEV